MYKIKFLYKCTNPKRFTCYWHIYVINTLTHGTIPWPPWRPWNSTVLTDLDIYTGFIPTQLMTSGCWYSL